MRITMLFYNICLCVRLIAQDRAVKSQSRSQSPRAFCSAPRHGADQKARGLWERDW